MAHFTRLELAQHIEHTILGPHLNRQDVEAGCALAAHEQCYAVIVKPHYVEVARKLLRETHVKVISVVGFPHGGMTMAAKMYETQDVLQRGAEEIEMVINLGALRDRDDLAVHNDIFSVVKTARGHPVTVILETFYLSGEEKTRGAKIAESAGASFVKTSTGFTSAGASADGIRLLCSAATKAQIKAAGGIDSSQTAQELLNAGAVRVATSQTEKILESLK